MRPTSAHRVNPRAVRRAGESDVLPTVGRVARRQQVQRFYGEDPSVGKESTNDGGFEFRTVGRFAEATFEQLG